MSFNEKVNELFNNVLERIASHYNLDFDELKTFAGTTSSGKKGAVSAGSSAGSKDEVDVSELTIEKVMTSNVVELKAFCKARKLVVGGKKDELISRLVDFIKKDGSGGDTGESKPSRARRSKSSKDEADDAPEKASKPVKSGKVSKSEKLAPDTHVAKVIESLREKRALVKLSKNEWGNLVDPQTNFVFDKTNKVIGLQKSNGDIAQLSDEDIENCKRMRLPYETPMNLDLDKLKIDDDDSDTDSDIEVVDADSDDSSETESDIE